MGPADHPEGNEKRVGRRVGDEAFLGHHQILEVDGESQLERKACLGMCPRGVCLNGATSGWDTWSDSRRALAIHVKWASRPLAAVGPLSFPDFRNSAINHGGTPTVYAAPPPFPRFSVGRTSSSRPK